MDPIEIAKWAVAVFAVCFAIVSVMVTVGVTRAYRRSQRDEAAQAKKDESYRKGWGR